MAQGFVLNIPQEMLNRIGVADTKIKQLATTSEQASQRIVAAFQQMNTQGINAFIQGLNTAQQKLHQLGNTQLNMGGSASVNGIQQLVNAIQQLSTASKTNITINGLGTVGSQTKTAIDAINKLMITLQQLQQMGGQQFMGGVNTLGRQTLREMNREAKKMENTLQKLDTAIKNYSVSALDLANKLQQARQAQQSFNQIAKQQAQSDVAGLIAQRGQQKTLNELKDYANELKRTMANLDPKSKEWQKLNAIYKQTNREIKNINNSMKDVGDKQKSLINTAEQLKRAFSLMFSVSAIKGYVTQIARVRGEFELQQISLQSILQDRDKANEIWDKTVQLAIRSPFQIKQLVTYTKQLAAYRVESDKLYDTTKRLADVSAGLGVDMQRLILAFGQVKAANYLRGTELRQFSEAGINMLGELSKYYTEIEKRNVSVAEVFERISKRMVFFEDVEEIFKRITDEGSIFYDMQAKQAETLKGQISNLRDSIDLMLNDIGKNNEGVLKGTVSLTRELIENWRAVATVLEIVIGGASIVWLANFARGIRLTGAALTFAAAQGTSAVGVAAKLKIAVSALNKTIAANPWLALAAAVIAAGVALWNYNKAVDAANEKYDEASVALMRQINKLNEQQAKIEENNRILKDAKSSEEELKEARKDNERILDELKQKYPQYYDSISQSVNGTIQLTEETKKLNEQLRVQSALQQAAKGGLLQEDLQENYSDLLEEINKREIAYAKIQSGLDIWQADIETDFQSGVMSEEEYNRILGIINKMREMKDIRLLNDAFAEAMKGYLFYSSSQEKLRDGLKDLQLVAYNSLQTAYSNYIANLDNGIDLFSTNIKKIYKESPEEAAKWLDTMLGALKIVDKEIKAWSWDYITKKVGVELVMPTGGEENKVDLADWQERYNEFVESLETNNVRQVRSAQETRENLRKSIAQQIKDQKALIAAYNVEGQQAYTKEEAEQAKKAIEDLLRAYEWLGGSEEDLNKKGDKEKKRLQDQIRLIQEMNKEYEKLAQIMPKDKAEQRVRQSYQPTADTLGLDISNMTFDDTGTIATLENLFTVFPDRLKAEIQKALDNYKAEFDIDELKKGLEKAKKDAEDYLERFDLSRSLDKMGISPEFAKKYFGFDYVNEDALSASLQSAKTDFAQFGKDGEKAYKEYETKVTNIERKAQEERLKTYLKYARNSVGERAKIKLEELRKLAEIEKTFTKPEQAQEKQAAQKAVKQESYQATQKLEWEEFQKTDTFINLFKDLDSASSTLINHAITKLNEFKDNWKDLPLEDMRSIVGKINELENALVLADPFQSARDLRKDGAGKKGNIEALQTEAIKTEAGISEAERELEILETVLRLRQEGRLEEEESYAIANKKSDLLQEDEESISNMVDSEEKRVKKLKKQLNTTNQKLSKEKQLVSAYKAQANAIGDAQKMANDLIDSFSELAEVLGADGDGIGMTFVNMGQDMMNTVLSTIQLQLQLKAAQIEAQALGIAMNSAMGIVGWIVMAVQLITQALAAIFKAKDKALENQIEALAEEAEDLQEKFDELRDSIDEIYSSDALAKTNEDLERLNKNLLSNLKAQKALQEQRKQTDEVKDEIKDLDDQIKEVEQDLIDAQKEVFSHATDGILDSAMDAARGFVDAWYDAFKETGDGMKGLEENFEEMLTNMLKQQAALAIVGVYTDRWKSELQGLFDNDGDLSEDEIRDWAEGIRNALPYIDKQLETYFNTVGDIIGGSDSLSGLQQEIGSMTEETAQILAAYLNSIRFFVAENNAVLKQLRDYQLGETDAANPMLAQLRIIAQQTSAIRNLLDSVTQAGHPNGQSGIRVFMD